MLQTEVGENKGKNQGKGSVVRRIGRAGLVEAVQGDSLLNAEQIPCFGTVPRLSRGDKHPVK